MTVCVRVCWQMHLCALHCIACYFFRRLYSSVIRAEMAVVWHARRMRNESTRTTRIRTVAPAAMEHGREPICTEREIEYNYIMLNATCKQFDNLEYLNSPIVR